LQLLDEDGDMEGLHVRESADAARLAVREAAWHIHIRLAFVIVVNLRREEF